MPALHAFPGGIRRLERNRISTLMRETLTTRRFGDVGRRLNIPGYVQGARHKHAETAAADAAYPPNT